MRTDLDVAYHECGHAAAAVVLAVPIRAVELHADGPEAGSVSYRAAGVPPDRLAVVVAAGPAADEYFSPGYLRPWEGPGARDREQFIEHCLGVADAQVRRQFEGWGESYQAVQRSSLLQALQSEFWASAQHLVRQHSQRIERLAVELVRSRVLTADRVASIWRAAS